MLPAVCGYRNWLPVQTCHLHEVALVGFKGDDTFLEKQKGSHLSAGDRGWPWQGESAELFPGFVTLHQRLQEVNHSQSPVKFAQVMAFPKALDMQQPVSGARADPQCPTELIIAISLEPAWLQQWELFPQKHRERGLEETPTHQDASGWGEQCPLTLILNQSLTLIQTLTQPVIATLILPLSLIPNFCCPFHFIKWI